MNTQENINYHRIAEAIDYIKANFKAQPNLDEVAEKVHLSPFHFQRLFTEWAGTSPKKFLQYISVEHAKKILKEGQATLFETAFETGLSGTGRLHDLFINIEGMTPAEYKNGGRDLAINYSFAESPFGNLIVATTKKGVCYMAFKEDEEAGAGGFKSKISECLIPQKAGFIATKCVVYFSKRLEQTTANKIAFKRNGFSIEGVGNPSQNTYGTTFYVWLDCPEN